ncbi:hypothetical protein RaK2_00372 [Klebsiella phage vB_KleM_RaK2]|uniref:Uncharacterized protein n=1 Tax=Klebsiella phage vB_KleM_RaK2 TaxID=1147094 RepID=H6X4H9_9CAUD|nr:hypothetical protein F403_gp163 [Klebsiella phage vB_KleM_RaK2]AFA44645.1 hypothetical protein RaK2_00372 [Klebsiella phage vB_KleM_RaK2]
MKYKRCDDGYLAARYYSKFVSTTNKDDLLLLMLVGTIKQEMAAERYINTLIHKMVLKHRLVKIRTIGGYEPYKFGVFYLDNTNLVASDSIIICESIEKAVQYCKNNNYRLIGTEV